MNITKSESNILYRNYFMAFIALSFGILNATPFRWNWHLEVLAYYLDQCRLGNIRRLIINLPPRSLKSHCASIAFPAFLLGHDPTAQIVCASYGQELSDKLARESRTLMQNQRYKEIFPATRLSPEKQSVSEFVTLQGGVRLSTSVGGQLTGRGGDIVLIDDPLKPDEALSDTNRKRVNEWYAHTLYSRLNDKRNGCIIIIMQRLHQDDLVGSVLEGEERWKVLRFPAIAEAAESHSIETPFGTKHYQRNPGEALHPEREPLEILEEIRKQKGEYNFAGQYQQNPAPLGGGMVKMDWLKRYAASEKPKEFEMIFQSWDTASKVSELNDFSVCTTWGVHRKHFYLLDVLRIRAEYPELKRRIVEQARRFEAKNILIEDKASGTQLIQDLRHEGLYITGYSTKMDKVMRLHSVTAMIEGGNVFLPEKADWLDVYLQELTTFPNSKFDDQADSTSQALDWAKEHGTQPAYLLYLASERMKMLLREGRTEEFEALVRKHGDLGVTVQQERPRSWRMGRYGFEIC